MKKTKMSYPIIAAAIVTAGAFIPAGFGGEKNPVPSQISRAALSDQVWIRLNQEFVQPLNVQAERSLQFSRRMPTYSTSYYLAETPDVKESGERHFQIMRKNTPIAKGQEPTSTEFLKVRYFEDTDKVLVMHKDAWMKPQEHPFLKLLPKAKSAPKITP